MLTLEGHPLAGAVRIQTESRTDGAVRCEVQIYDRAGSVPDLLVMRTLGGMLQNRAWTQLVQNVIDASGGEKTDVQHSSETLSQSEGAVVHRWAEELVL